MTTIKRPAAAAQAYRCKCSTGIDAEQCELERDHSGVHAIGAPDGYLTWDEGATEKRWRLYPPPPWLIVLPWAPGFQPTIRRPGSGSGHLEVDER